MDDTGRQAAQRHIDSLAEPRRSQMQHLHDLILATEPDMDVRVLDDAGGMIGYGWYAYSNSKGPAGDWFSVGLANRKSYISLYSMGIRDGGYWWRPCATGSQARSPAGVASTSASRIWSTTTPCGTWSADLGAVPRRLPPAAAVGPIGRRRVS